MPQIFVTGVERSGATLAAKILHDALGVLMGNVGGRLRPPRPGWTHQTFEDARLHEILIGSFESEGDLRDAFAEYIRDRGELSGPTWGAKSCAFGSRLPLLVSLCDAPVVIDVWRSPAAVMASYEAATDQPYQAVQAWYLKARSAHDAALARVRCPVLSVDFEALVDDPALLSRALEGFGVIVTRPDLTYSTLDQALVHYDAVGRYIPRAATRKLGPWGKVAVGVRTANGPEAEFFICYQQLLSALRPGDGALRPVANMPAHWAADALARAFLMTDADALFMLDDDMTFSSGDLERLREHAEGQQFDILSAFATRRQYPPRPITMRRLKYQPPQPMSLQGVHYAHVLEYRPEYRVFDADMTGLAFTLIRRHVFEAMIGEWGPAWTQFFPMVSQQSDDAQFCVQAKALGMRIGVCLDVPIGHIGKQIYGRPQLEGWLAEVSDALNAELGGTDAPAAA